MTEETKRWKGFTHEELYRLLHEGPGAQASADPARRWTEVSSTLADVGQDLATALDSSGANWIGRAAGRAYDKLSPLAAWATATSEAADTMRLAVENQGDYIAKARADMPAPESVPQQQPDPTIAPAVQVLGAQNDSEPIEAAQSSGEQRAFEVMAVYEQNTAGNLAAVTAFDQPAELLRGNGERHSNRGLGITLSAIATTVASAVATVIEDRPRGHHGPPVRESFGHQGVVLSGATLEAPAARPAAASPGISSGAAPVEQHPALGAAPRPAEATRDNRRARQPAPSTPLAAVDDLSGSPAAPMTGAGAGTGAPVSSAGLAPTTAADKLAMRRFGTEALGSSQWFGDTVDSTPSRQVSGRRRDLGATDHVTESVTVDGEDHQLPPTVIGG